MQKTCFLQKRAMGCPRADSRTVRVGGRCPHGPLRLVTEQILNQKSDSVSAPLMLVSSYFRRPPSSQQACMENVYVILKMLMSFLRRKTVRCSLWDVDDESECFVTAQISTNKNSQNQNRLLAKQRPWAKKKGEVGLLVEYLFCGLVMCLVTYLMTSQRQIRNKFNFRNFSHFILHFQCMDGLTTNLFIN